jgi:hypothetical protein
VIALLPSEGVVHVSTAEESPAVAAVIAGAPGTVYGMTAVDFGLPTDVPYALVAVTAKVYEAPTVRPVNVRDSTEGPTVTGVPAVVPRYGVTVYEVIALPLSAGATHDTVALVTPAAAVGAARAEGAEA